jgi:hypothetical protein
MADQLTLRTLGGTATHTLDDSGNATHTGTVTADSLSVTGSATLPTSFQRTATVSITNAEMLALRATPKTLVAAPGAGYVIEFVSAELFFDYTAVYTESADNMAIRFTDGSGTIVSQAIEATGFLTATADTKTNALPKIDAISAKTACDNALLCLHNTGDGEYGGGNAANVVRVRVTYRVHPAGW